MHHDPLRYFWDARGNPHTNVGTNHARLVLDKLRAMLAICLVEAVVGS